MTALKAVKSNFWQTALLNRSSLGMAIKAYVDIKKNLESLENTARYYWVYVFIILGEQLWL